MIRTYPGLLKQHIGEVIGSSEKSRCAARVKCKMNGSRKLSPLMDFPTNLSDAITWCHAWEAILRRCLWVNVKSYLSAVKQVLVRRLLSMHSREPLRTISTFGWRVGSVWNITGRVRPTCHSSKLLDDSVASNNM